MPQHVLQTNKTKALFFRVVFFKTLSGDVALCSINTVCVLYINLRGASDLLKKDWNANIITRT